MISKKARVLIVGAGGISTRHYFGWKNSNLAQICGIMDISQSVALKRKEEWGCDVDIFDSLSTAIISTEPTIVDICTSEHTHAQVSLEVLSYNVPVLTEKIMAHSLVAGYKMVLAARKEHCWAGVTYNYPFFPAISKLKEFIYTRKAGTLQALNITCHSFCYHHVLSVLYWLFGTPDTIDAHGTKHEWPEGFAQLRTDDDLLYIPTNIFSCRIVFNGNIVCTITSSLSPSLNVLPFHIIGIFDSSRVIEINGLNWNKNMKGRMFYLPDIKDSVGLGDIPGTIGNEISFDGYFADAAKRLLSQQGPIFNWEDGWNIMLIEHAMVLSDKRRATINFHDLKAEKETELEGR